MCSRDRQPAAAGRSRLALIIAAALFAISVGGHIVDGHGHPTHAMLARFDLGVCDDAGLPVRHSPGRLYFGFNVFVLTGLILLTALPAAAWVAWRPRITGGET
jgi:hypothetical protein